MLSKRVPELSVRLRVCKRARARARARARVYVSMCVWGRVVVVAVDVPYFFACKIVPHGSN